MDKTIVIDASISLAWLLKEKPYRHQLKKLLDDISMVKIVAIAPTIWLYETVNGLRTAIVRKRITEALAKKKIPDVLEIMPNLYDLEPLIASTFQIATKLDLSIYDASYVALAQEEGYNFFTADEKLYRKVSKKFPFVKLVSEYES